MNDLNRLDGVMASSPEGISAAERSRLMSEFSIVFDGRHYQTRGYRYDRLADAVDFARGMLARSPSTESPPTVIPIDLPPVKPSDADSRLMAQLGIGFRQGAFEFGGSRYDKLDDALHYARLLTPGVPAK